MRNKKVKRFINSFETGLHRFLAMNQTEQSESTEPDTYKFIKSENNSFYTGLTLVFTQNSLQVSLG